MLYLLIAALTTYATLVAGLWLYARRHPDVVSMRAAFTLIPDVLRLTRRLVADNSLPRGVRIRMALLVAYLLSPIDLVPDFVPVVGYIDDVVVIALVLRSTIRRAGPQALERNWPGSPEGLQVIRRLAGLSHPSAT